MNVNLVNAYKQGVMSEAYKEMGKGRRGVSDVLGKVGKDLNKIGTDLANKRETDAKTEAKRISDGKKTGQDLATKVLDRSGALNENYLNAYRPQVEDLQAKYDAAVQSGDKDLEQKLLGQLNDLSATTATWVDFRKDVAQTIDTKSVDGKAMPNLISGLDSDTQNLLNSILDSNTEVVFEDGVSKIKGPDGKLYSKGDLEKVLDNAKRDVATHNDLLGINDSLMQEAAINESLSTDDNSYKPFDRDKTNRRVMQILETSNIQSILNDNVFTGETTMAENIKDYIGGLSYEALGIDTVSSKGQIYDTDGDGKISMEEAKLISQEDSDKIFDALTNPENENYNDGITKKTVGNYYTSILEKNYGGTRKDVVQANEKNYDLLNKKYFGS
tara:strand:- start:11967 stop:13124 length:1158 start_codon:yes stop_codon:yes gene_type:complete